MTEDRTKKLKEPNLISTWENNNLWKAKKMGAVQISRKYYPQGSSHHS